MAHPSLEDIVRGAPDVTAHLASCATCRALAAVAGAAAEPVGEDAFPSEHLDRERYVDWRALGAGGGGMGRTFLARDRRLGRDVVIKQPLGGDRAPGLDLRARFEREALLTARLQHPSIVGVYEAGRFPDGEPFYAMPLVRGAPLSDEIDRRTTIDERLALLAHVTTACEAIAYAHEQGIVHRDVKPANILVGTFGETVLIDWGLAADLRADAGDAPLPAVDVADGLTQLGIGTPHYMPPEQARGSAPDPRMDVYALGATLYHTLAGTPPFGTTDSGQARRMLLEDAAPLLATVAPDVPPPLCDIVTRAMSRDPAARFASARELAAELRRFQTGQLVQSRRYTPGEILRHFARRYRAPLVVAGIAGLLLAVGGIASAVRITRAGRAASAAQARAEANERTSQQALRQSLGVSASRLALSPTRRLDALELAVDAVAPDVAAGAAPTRDAMQGLFDAIAAGAPAVALETGTTAIGRFAFSRDGALLATLSPGEHVVELWDGRTGALRRTVAAGGAHFAVRDVCFAPDGASLLTWGDEPAQAQLWPVAEGPPVTLALDGVIAGADFLPDGTIVVAGRALVFHGRDGVETRRVTLTSDATGLAIAGERIAVSEVSGAVLVVDATGAVQATLRVPAVAEIALSRDGMRVAALNATAVGVYDVAGAPRRIASVALPVAPGPHAELAFADERFVVVSERGRGSLVVDVARGTAAEAGAPVAATAPWSGDGARLALLDLEAMAPVRTIDGPPGRAVAALGVVHDHRVAAATERASWLVDARADATGAMPGHTSEVTAAMRVGATLVSAGLDGRLVAWDTDGRAGDIATEDTELLVAIAAGTFVVAGGADGRVTARTVVDGRFGPPATLAPAGAPIAALAASPDGRAVVIARADGALEAAATDGTRPATSWQQAGGSPATIVVFTRDGSGVATGHIDGMVRVWRIAHAANAAPAAAAAAEGTLADRDAPGRAQWRLAFDHRGQLLASRTSAETVVFTFPQLEKGTVLAGRLLAVSDDGARVAVLAPDGHVVLDGQRVAAASRPIVIAAFSADASRLVTGDVDGTVRVLDLATREMLELPAAGGGAVTALAIAANHDSVVVGHASGALRHHPLAPALALGRACRTLAGFGRDVAGCAGLR